MDFALARERMVGEQLRGRGIRDARVLAALGKVPRHRFVEEAFAERAYGDYPLPIGERQTISQPYMVAAMTEALELTGPERVLEVGTGSGYQTAVLAELAEKVYSLERLRGLSERAERRVEALGYYNVRFRAGDGTLGWPEEAPFDAIVVTAAAPAEPPALLEQLRDRGRLVIPVGGEAAQTLWKVVRVGDRFRRTALVPCVFVRLIGAQGWQDGLGA
jgi:protein-L-isoaspartate(D-aspartate) O-methyltransferase